MKKSIAELVELLASLNPRERALGLTFVGKQRCYAMQSRTTEALMDSDDDVRAMAAWALDRLSSPASVPALLGALHDPVFGVRSNAGWALVHMARRLMPEMVVPDVIEVLSDSSDDNARQMAYLVLHHIGGDVAHEAIRLYWRR
jgi:HEAT repeat protein